ncbi:MAG: HIT family protein [Desulfobacteraceae bacterium 4572_35.1]|nr:MAG: HIT family protein [Desulfobacteraceae bacterium 4572_35.1]
MTNFTLDPQLDRDCITLGTFGNSLLLLLDNSLVPWFILVPKTTFEEIFDMEPKAQHILIDEINKLGNFLRYEFNTDKVNTAAIGNIVRQLHIHVVGRYEDDFCWPNVVWGTDEKKNYTSSELQSIVSKLQNGIGDYFTAFD